MSTTQDLRGDIVLGRYYVASIAGSDGCIAIAIGGESSLSYANLRVKREEMIEELVVRTLEDGCGSESEGSDETKHVARL